MNEAREKVMAVLIALLVQLILVAAAWSVCYWLESSTVGGVPPAASAQGVPEPLL